MPAARIELEIAFRLDPWFDQDLWDRRDAEIERSRALLWRGG